MANAPLPEMLPGCFFYVEYDRDDETYTIHLDDAGDDDPSYNLGNVTEAMHKFDLWAFTAANGRTLLHAAHLALDVAREYGASVAMYAENPPRVWPHYDRRPARLQLNEGVTSGCELPEIPSARYGG